MARRTNAASGPIVHLIRHAESEHKPGDGTPNVYEHLKDPILTSRGRKHCMRRNEFLHSEAEHITHILASPLSRALETAFLTFKAVTDRGIKVWAMPELQSLSSAPSGLGMNLSDLKTRFDVKSPGKQVNASSEGKSKNTTKVEPFNVDDFKGKLELQYMSKDWNDEYENKEGRWSAEHEDWRAGYLNGFMRGLASHGEKVEIVVVCHSSSLRFLNEDLLLYGNELKLSTFTFNKFGDLVPMTEGQVTRARAQGLGKKSQSSIPNTIQPAEPLSEVRTKIVGDIEQPLLPVPAIKISVKKAKNKANHPKPPNNPSIVVSPRKAEATLPLIKDEPQNKVRGNIVEDELDEWPMLERAKVPRKVKIQSKSKLTRSSEILGNAKVHKKATSKRKTGVEEKHHMILRNRVKIE